MRGIVEEILRIAQIDRRQRPEGLRAFNKRHAAVLRRRILEGDPDRCLVPAVGMRPVDGVLMPRRLVVALAVFSHGQRLVPVADDGRVGIDRVVTLR